jgi:hypothetical protein
LTIYSLLKPVADGDQRTQLLRGALSETCGDCRVLALVGFLEAGLSLPSITGSPV